MANGKRGAPFGNQNAAGPRDRVFSDALRRAVLAKDGERLRRMADSLIEKAEQGDVSALREAADRIEGKVPQAIQHEGGDVPLKILLGQEDAGVL